MMRLPYSMLLSLLLLVVLALMAKGAAMAEDDEVITVIDVNFHHLGDHFVPTYQPQTPEGLEYEVNFTVEGEVENPAIKMWIRGQVPPQSASLGKVRLFVNDQLLGYLNEYAMGSGSIYETDDEVEIEVSIEEGVLRQGTNNLKIITGWGTRHDDRDDIMFWNIRLIRARPIEVSLNLITPSPGDVAYAGLDTQKVSLLLWNDRHVDAIQWVVVTIDPGGAAVSYRWVQKTNAFTLEAGATTHAEFPPGWSWSSKDILNRTWVLGVRLTFLWSFPSDGPLDITVRIRDDQTRIHSFTFEEVLTVRSQLAFSGPALLRGEDQRPLGPGSWVRGGEVISVSVPPVIYEDSQDAMPPQGTMSLAVEWDGMMMGQSAPPTAGHWTLNWTVPMVPLASPLVSIKGIDLPQGARPIAPLEVGLQVDGRAPTWLSFEPPSGSWLTSGSLEITASLTDSGASGIDPFTVEYQLWTSGEAGWGPWMSAGLLTGEGTEATGMAALQLPEDTGHRVRWRALDVVGNGPAVSQEVVLNVDMSPVTIEHLGTQDWHPSTSVEVRCKVHEGSMTGSGVDLGTIEYSYLLTDGSGWSSWTSPDDVSWSSDHEHVEAWANVTLAEGPGNYVRWRAKDLAGNPFTLSEPFMVRVDSEPPELLENWPVDTTFPSVDDVTSVAIFGDQGGSGVNGSRVQFSLRLGGGTEWSDWTTVTSDPEVRDRLRVAIAVQVAEGHDNWIRWRVWDAVGNGPAEFGPFRLRVNLPPTAVIASPSDGSLHFTSDSVALSAEGSSDPDPDDELTYEWWSDLDGALGSGRELEALLRLGTHTITLRVDDGLGGDHVAVAQVQVRVVEETDVRGPPWSWLFLAVIVCVALAVGIREAVRARRRRFRE